MTRRLRLVRSVTAGSGGWGGDGTVWQGDDPGNAPKPADAPAIEVGSPIFTPQFGPDGGPSSGRSTGVSGIVRLSGGDSTRRFELRLVLGYLKVNGEDQRIDWERPSGPTPPTPADPMSIGDGEDFTTLPFNLPNQMVAFHLIPVGGNLAEDSRIEIWAAEVEE